MTTQHNNDDQYMETDIHILIRPETEALRAMFTITQGTRPLCYYSTKEQAMERLGELLDELAGRTGAKDQEPAIGSRRIDAESPTNPTTQT